MSTHRKTPSPFFPAGAGRQPAIRTVLLLLICMTPWDLRGSAPARSRAGPFGILAAGAGLSAGRQIRRDGEISADDSGPPIRLCRKYILDVNPKYL
jgi:hypothetical protein